MAQHGFQIAGTHPCCTCIECITRTTGFGFRVGNLSILTGDQSRCRTWFLVYVCLNVVVGHGQSLTTWKWYNRPVLPVLVADLGKRPRFDVAPRLRQPRVDGMRVSQSGRYGAARGQQWPFRRECLPVPMPCRSERRRGQIPGKPQVGLCDAAHIFTGNTRLTWDSYARCSTFSTRSALPAHAEAPPATRPGRRAGLARHRGHRQGGSGALTRCAARESTWRLAAPATQPLH